MTPQEAMAKLEADPAFAKFSYQEQAQIKAKVLPNYLVKDPAFLALNPGERALAFQQIVQGPPSLEDKNLQGQMLSLAQTAADPQNPKAKQAQASMGMVSQNSRLVATSLMWKALGVDRGNG